jgi:signal recognition particle receptor subunit beta
MDPSKAVQFLNNLQKADRPEAYEPEIVTQQRRKEALLRELEAKAREEEEIRDQIEKTLFDFDDEID